jgi:hypothetical protein
VFLELNHTVLFGGSLSPQYLGLGFTKFRNWSYGELLAAG